MKKYDNDRLKTLVPYRFVTAGYFIFSELREAEYMSEKITGKY